MISQEHCIRVREITRLSLRILGKMYDEDALRFCFTLKKAPAGKELLSFRYTAIALLGLDQASRHGLLVCFPLTEICTDIALCASQEVDLGNKGLALWAALKLRSHAAHMALKALLEHGGFITNTREGLIRSTELAWAVYALALAWEDMETRDGGLLSRHVQDAVWGSLQKGIHLLRAQRHAQTGLFQCAGLPTGNGCLRDRMKTTSGFFDSQVYGAMALAQAGRVLDRADLLQEAYGTVQALVRHQGKYGEWPWHYDVRAGTIIDLYPIFSVHQDGMGPMVLLEVGELLRTDFQDAVERSLKWVFGDNALQVPLIDQELGMIWRAQCRKGIQQYVLQASRLAHHYGLPLIARVLHAAPGRAIVYECRPYHLGWLLYAFCRHSQLIPAAADNDAWEG